MPEISSEQFNALMVFENIQEKLMDRLEDLNRIFVHGSDGRKGDDELIRCACGLAYRDCALQAQYEGRIGRFVLAAKPLEE